MNRLIICVTALALVGLTCEFAAAEITAAKFAAENETIESDGPSGTPWFHNAQGNNPDDDETFEEFAVSDYLFEASDFGVGAVTDITQMTVTYTQDNPSFTNAGAVEIWMADGTSAFGDLTYDGNTNPGGVSTAAGLSGLGSSSLQVIGTGTFTPTNDGDADTYNITPAGDAKSALIDAINGGEEFRLVLAAGEAGTAATYAGIENFDHNGPEVSITAVPEPGSFLLLGLGSTLVGGVMLLRRRQQTANSGN